MSSFSIEKITYLHNLNLMNKKSKNNYINPESSNQDQIIILHDMCDQKMMNEIVNLGLKTGIIPTETDMSGGAVTVKPELNEKNITRREGPKKSTDWLSTTHINNIFKYYQTVFPDFIFLGAVPQDCYQYEACNLHNTQFDKLLNDGKSKVGIVFNLDNHRGGGSHWVALWLNLISGQSYYCDSVGNKPLQDSQEFIDSFCSWYKRKYGKPCDKKVNTIKYQKDGSECGVYSCNFIIRMLNGEESFDEIIKNNLDFKGINSCRDVYFSNKTSKYEPGPICDPITLEHSKNDLKKS
jgi:hypothetical protein